MSILHPRRRRWLLRLFLTPALASALQPQQLRGWSPKQVHSLREHQPKALGLRMVPQLGLPRTVEICQKRSPLVRVETPGKRQWAAVVAMVRTNPALRTRKSRARMAAGGEPRVVQEGAGVDELVEVVAMPRIAGGAAEKGRGVAKEAPAGVGKAKFCYCNSTFTPLMHR